MKPSILFQRNRRLRLKKAPALFKLQGALVQRDYLKLLTRKNDKLIAELQRVVIGNDVSIGGWTCLYSPIKICCYAPDDSCQDFCLYCGNPDERK